MLFEYAVEPNSIGTSWERFYNVVEKFGFDRGRLISQFPKAWFRLVHEAANGLNPVEKKRIEAALIQAKQTRVIRTNRPYDADSRSWLQNAIEQHARSPFHAIIAGSNPSAHQSVLLVNDMDESQPLMAATHDQRVSRDAASLATAMKMMLQSASFVAFVDAYYDPFDLRFQNTIRDCLQILKAANPLAICEIHHLDRVRNCPSIDAIEREARAKFGAVIPDGMTISLYRWKQKPGGNDFHARYLLTDRGGIHVDAGFQAVGGHQSTDMTLMAFDLSQQRRAELARDATAFELVEPVLRIARSGHVERL